MAETTKLSVGKVLDKLRTNDEVQKSRAARLDEKIDDLARETERVRAERLRLKRIRSSSSTKRD